ncbi:MAG: hydrolase [Bacteroidales bacterium]|nr:hydrolase [Bacteroidales bacterium]
MEYKMSNEHTALVVIDLQKGIVAMPTEPYSSKQVIENSLKIIESARKNKMPVFLVHVTPSADGKDTLHPVVASNFSFERPADWADYIPELNIQPTDFLITKRQWGAFYGTELDLQLRRRGIDTIILCGIATNMGVESTARYAFEHGYNQIFAEDAMAARSEVMHSHPVQYTFPRLGLVMKTDEVLKKMNE